ncbi:hypothetical protein [Cellulomonas sp. RIT-PI-Y]|uniref:hypothetical protein n=1 Tax=Cellulomonas sp. RIT-PI-Y TaxID=3035297 RepID=UPI0021DACF2B|nr:hypothetical protein [Cellulomonas sp. RIT-PI-Y]
MAFRMWADGVLVQDLTLLDPEAEVSSAEVVPVGLSWKKLNNCLNQIGINWAVLAVISVACSAACATMVACAPCIAVAAGWTGGSIGACVKHAWT